MSQGSESCPAGCIFSAALGATPEREPNDKLDSPNPDIFIDADGPFSADTLIVGSLPKFGTIDTDKDTFKFINPSATERRNLRLDTFNAALGLGVPCGGVFDGADTSLVVERPDNTEIAHNDARASNTDECAGLDVVLDPGQVVFVTVSTFFQPVQGYLLQSTFSTIVCGDGVVVLGESCDDGNTVTGDGCAGDCSAVEAGFVCDPGACHPIACGDGILDAPELCDDGNTVAGDGCSSICQIEGVGFDCLAGQTLLQVSAIDVPKAIPDNNATGVLSTLNIADNRTIKKAIVGVDSLTHTFDGDLQLSLVSPSGATVSLSNHRGGNGDNYTNTIFDDACIALDGLIANGVAPFSGCFAPEALLSVLNNQSANGDWKLKLVDTANQDTGTLNSWTLGLCVQ